MANFDALARPVRYRLSPGEAVDLNSVELLTGGMKRGVMLEEFDFSQVQAVGYTEKRAQGDGMDASDVYLGARLIRLGGVVYGTGPGDLQDRVQVVRTALTPTIAYAADEPNYGYLPLEFELPTADVDFGTGTTVPGYRPLEFRSRPRNQPTFTLRRDAGQGAGEDFERGGAISFQAVLECIDPRMYVRPPIWSYRPGPSGSFSLKNRGDYPAPLDILIEVPVSWAQHATGAYVQFVVGNSTIRLYVPQVAKVQVIRYSSALKVATLEVDGVESLRMDLLRFPGATIHPTIQPGTNLVTMSASWSGGALGANTRLMYSESFA